MRRNVTYSKNGERRLKETVKDLKSMLNQLRKENRVLRQELENIMKPERPRREPEEDRTPKLMTQEDWRKDFIKNFRPGLDKHLEEFDYENTGTPEKDK